MLQMGTNIMANQFKASIQNYFEKVLYENLTFEIPPLWFLPASPKAEAGLGIAFSVRPSVPARQNLLSVICNSNSFQSILFKLRTVFAYILKMCTSYYGQIGRIVSYIVRMLNQGLLYKSLVELSHFLSLYDIDCT